MCEIINITDAIQKYLDDSIKMLQSADTTETEFKTKIDMMYAIDDTRAHLARARLFANQFETAQGGTI